MFGGRVHTRSHLPFLNGSRAPREVLKRFTNKGKLELKAGFEQTAGGHSPALDEQFSFRPQHKGSDLEHPIGCRQAKGHPTDLSQSPHHLRVRNWMRRRKVNRAFEMVVPDQPLNRPAAISFVDPGDELSTAAHAAPEPEPGQATKYRKDTVLPQAQDHRHTHRNLPRSRSCGFVEGSFPSPRHLHRETILRLHRGFGET